MASKTVLLTGASKGLGLAIADYILAQPQKHNLVVVARDQAALEKIKSKDPKRVEIVPGDLSDFSLPAKAVEVAKSSFGGLHALVINHGILGQTARLVDADPAKWRDMFSVNFFSAVACVQAAIPELRKTKGSIVLTSSGSAVKGTAAQGAYGASKASLNHLALTLQSEEPDITTVAVRPGQVDTDMMKELREKHGGVMDKNDREHFANAYKEGKLLRPDQPGNVLAKLALDPPRELSGKFLTWNDEVLKGYQE